MFYALYHFEVREIEVFIDVCISPVNFVIVCAASLAICASNAWRTGGTAHEGGGCDQSIRSTISDAIVRSWLISK